MKVVGAVLLAVFVGLGVRSAWYWIRRPFASDEVTDHLLYAAFVTGRVGLWFAVGGAIAILLSLESEGSVADEYSWYLLVPGILAFLQLLATVLLGRRGDEGPRRDTPA